MTTDDLGASQEQLGKALERAHMGEDRDLAGQVRDGGERFVRQLFGTLRLTRIHELSNSAFDKPVNDLHKSLAELNRLLGAVHLVAVEGQVYINDVRVRLDERLDTAGELGRELGRHDVGGISFHEVPDTVKIKALIAAFGVEPDPDRPRLALRDRIRGHGLDLVDLVGSYRFRMTGEEADVGVVDQDKARDRASSLVDSTIDSLGAARMPNPLPVRRAVTELLEAGASADALFDEPAHSTPFSRHTLRTSMLALLIGKALGLGQEALQDLGVAAMFHDVGYAAREGALPATDDAPAQAGFPPPFSRHGAAGARILLRQRGFHESKILRALAALQHHRAYDDERGRPVLFARILHVCESYEAMTILGPGRRDPPDALAALQMHAGTRYDPDIVQALINALGRWPPGTRLLLGDGRVVVVNGTPTGAEDWARPRCRLVRAADGMPATEVVKVDLTVDPARIIGISAS
jgi:hypothetical protein